MLKVYVGTPQPARNSFGVELDEYFIEVEQDYLYSFGFSRRPDGGNGSIVLNQRYENVLGRSIIKGDLVIIIDNGPKNDYALGNDGAICAMITSVKKTREDITITFETPMCLVMKHSITSIFDNGNLIHDYELIINNLQNSTLTEPIESSRALLSLRDAIMHVVYNKSIFGSIFQPSCSSDTSFQIVAQYVANSSLFADVWNAIRLDNINIHEEQVKIVDSSRTYIQTNFIISNLDTKLDTTALDVSDPNYPYYTFIDRPITSAVVLTDYFGGVLSNIDPVTTKYDEIILKFKSQILKYRINDQTVYPTRIEIDMSDISEEYVISIVDSVKRMGKVDSYNGNINAALNYGMNALLFNVHDVLYIDSADFDIYSPAEVDKYFIIDSVDISGFEPSITFSIKNYSINIDQTEEFLKKLRPSTDKASTVTETSELIDLEIDVNISCEAYAFDFGGVPNGPKYYAQKISGELPGYDIPSMTLFENWDPVVNSEMFVAEHEADKAIYQYKYNEDKNVYALKEYTTENLSDNALDIFETVISKMTNGFSIMSTSLSSRGDDTTNKYYTYIGVEIGLNMDDPAFKLGDSFPVLSLRLGDIINRGIEYMVTSPKILPEHGNIYDEFRYDGAWRSINIGEEENLLINTSSYPTSVANAVWVFFRTIHPDGINASIKDIKLFASGVKDTGVPYLTRYPDSELAIKSTFDNSILLLADESVAKYGTYTATGQRINNEHPIQFKDLRDGTIFMSHNYYGYELDEPFHGSQTIKKYIFTKANREGAICSTSDSYSDYGQSFGNYYLNLGGWPMTLDKIEISGYHMSKFWPGMQFLVEAIGVNQIFTVASTPDIIYHSTLKRTIVPVVESIPSGIALPGYIYIESGLINNFDYEETAIDVINKTAVISTKYLPGFDRTNTTSIPIIAHRPNAILPFGDLLLDMDDIVSGYGAFVDRGTPMRFKNILTENDLWKVGEIKVKDELDGSDFVNKYSTVSLVSSTINTGYNRLAPKSISCWITDSTDSSVDTLYSGNHIFNIDDSFVNARQTANYVSPLLTIADLSSVIPEISLCGIDSSIFSDPVEEEKFSDRLGFLLERRSSSPIQFAIAIDNLGGEHLLKVIKIRKSGTNSINVYFIHQELRNTSVTGRTYDFERDANLSHVVEIKFVSSIYILSNYESSPTPTYSLRLFYNEVGNFIFENIQGVNILFHSHVYAAPNAYIRELISDDGYTGQSQRYELGLMLKFTINSQEIIDSETEHESISFLSRLFSSSDDPLLPLIADEVEEYLDPLRYVLYGNYVNGTHENPEILSDWRYEDSEEFNSFGYSYLDPGSVLHARIASQAIWPNMYGSNATYRDPLHSIALCRGSIEDVRIQSMSVGINFDSNDSHVLRNDDYDFLGWAWSKTIDPLPSNAGIGDIYIKTDNTIATYNGTSWVISSPSEREALYVVDEKKIYAFDGSAWDEATLSTQLNISKEDEYNRFSSKLGMYSVDYSYRHWPTIMHPYIDVRENTWLLQNTRPTDIITSQKIITSPPIDNSTIYEMVARLDTPPSPSPGDAGKTWIVGSSAGVPWTGHENAIALWSGSSWSYGDPIVGYAYFVIAEQLFYVWHQDTHMHSTSGEWLPFSDNDVWAVSGMLYPVGYDVDGWLLQHYYNTFLISNGTITTDATDEFTDSAATGWATDVLVGYHVYITTGTWKTQWRTIIANTTTTVTVDSPWTGTPAIGDSYRIVTPDFRGKYIIWDGVNAWDWKHWSIREADTGDVVLSGSQISTPMLISEKMGQTNYSAELIDLGPRGWMGYPNVAPQSLTNSRNSKIYSMKQNVGELLRDMELLVANPDASFGSGDSLASTTELSLNSNGYWRANFDTLDSYEFYGSDSSKYITPIKFASKVMPITVAISSGNIIKPSNIWSRSISSGSEVMTFVQFTDQEFMGYDLEYFKSGNQEAVDNFYETGVNNPINPEINQRIDNLYNPPKEPGWLDGIANGIGKVAVALRIRDADTSGSQSTITPLPTSNNMVSGYSMLFEFSASSLQNPTKLKAKMNAAFSFSASNSLTYRIYVSKYDEEYLFAGWSLINGTAQGAEQGEISTALELENTKDFTGKLYILFVFTANFFNSPITDALFRVKNVFLEGENSVQSISTNRHSLLSLYEPTANDEHFLGIFIEPHEYGLSEISGVTFNSSYILEEVATERISKYEYLPLAAGKTIGAIDEVFVVDAAGKRWSSKSEISTGELLLSDSGVVSRGDGKDHHIMGVRVLEGDIGLSISKIGGTFELATTSSNIFSPNLDSYIAHYAFANTSIDSTDEVLKKDRWWWIPSTAYHTPLIRDNAGNANIYGYNINTPIERDAAPGAFSMQVGQTLDPKSSTYIVSGHDESHGHPVNESDMHIIQTMFVSDLSFVHGEENVNPWYEYWDASNTEKLIGKNPHANGEETKFIGNAFIIGTTSKRIYDHNSTVDYTFIAIPPSDYVYSVAIVSIYASKNDGADAWSEDSLYIPPCPGFLNLVPHHSIYASRTKSTPNAFPFAIKAVNALELKYRNVPDPRIYFVGEVLMELPQMYNNGDMGDGAKYSRKYIRNTADTSTEEYYKWPGMRGLRGVEYITPIRLGIQRSINDSAIEYNLSAIRVEDGFRLLLPQELIPPYAAEDRYLIGAVWQDKFALIYTDGTNVGDRDFVASKQYYNNTLGRSTYNDPDSGYVSRFPYHPNGADFNIDLMGFASQSLYVETDGSGNIVSHANQASRACAGIYTDSSTNTFAGYNYDYDATINRNLCTVYDTSLRFQQVACYIAADANDIVKCNIGRYQPPSLTMSFIDATKATYLKKLNYDGMIQSYDFGATTATISGTLITDGSKTGPDAWTTNELQDKHIFVGSYRRKIVSNTSNTITVDIALPTGLTHPIDYAVYNNNYMDLNHRPLYMEDGGLKDITIRFKINTS